MLKVPRSKITDLRSVIKYYYFLTLVKKWIIFEGDWNLNLAFLKSYKIIVVRVASIFVYGSALKRNMSLFNPPNLAKNRKLTTLKIHDRRITLFSCLANI